MNNVSRVARAYELGYSAGYAAAQAEIIEQAQQIIGYAAAQAELIEATRQIHYLQ